MVWDLHPTARKGRHVGHGRKTTQMTLGDPLAGVFQAAVAYKGAKEAKARAEERPLTKRRAGQAIPQEP